MGLAYDIPSILKWYLYRGVRKTNSEERRANTRRSRAVHTSLMTTATGEPRMGEPVASSARPTRMELLVPMLNGTLRGGVPVRRSFLQVKNPNSGGTLPGKLAKLARDESALDTYLLISAMASSSEPYDTWFPSSTWAQMARLDNYAEEAAARARWAKLVTKLVDERLVMRKRRGNKMNYILLDESGSGVPYMRPTKTAHGLWFSIPHLYWTQEFDKELTLPEKAMLFISLDQPDDFRMPADQVPAWYGLSESTAHRGFNGLVRRGILSRTSTQQPDPKSPSGWKTVIRYKTEGDWSLTNRKALMLATRRRKVAFTDAQQQDSE